MGRLGYPCVTILVERTPFLRDRSADLGACVGRAGGSRGPSDRNQVCGVMSPELPEAEIRRIVRERLREGVLRKAPTALPEARGAGGGNSCWVCGFAIPRGRGECQVAGASAHERCAMVWIDESKRASRR